MGVDAGEGEALVSLPATLQAGGDNRWVHASGDQVALPAQHEPKSATLCLDPALVSSALQANPVNNQAGVDGMSYILGNGASL